MKKLTLKIAVFLFFTFYFQLSTAFAQAPKFFKYQAVARSSNGDVLANQLVNFKISILKTSATGPSVYIETQNFTTNQFGLANLVIGNGTLVSGNFNTIDWGNDEYFVKIEFDATGGTNFVEMGTSQLLSVPYALYSEASGGDGVWTKDSNEVYLSDSTGNVGIGTEIPLSKLHVYSGECISSNGMVQFTQDGSTNNPTLVVKQTTSGGNNYDYQGLLVDVAGVAQGYAFGIKNSGTPRFVIQNNGNVGVGITNPWSKLHLFGTGYSNGLTLNRTTMVGFNLNHGMDGVKETLYFGFTSNSGSTWSPMMVLNELGKVGIGITNPWSKLHLFGTGYSNGLTLNRTTMVGFNLNHGLDGVKETLYFGFTSNSGSTWSPIMVLNELGNVGIGTSNPTYKLSVNGTIRAKEIIVETGWSDFVFEKDYKLMSLADLERFINKNKHLPNIPSAADVEKNGLKLGESDAKLLQTIEEQMLYILNINKRLEKVEKENAELKEQIKNLK